MTDSVDLKNCVLERIGGAAPRTVWTPADFLDLGTRDAIDKVLQRLVAADTLRRIDRGLYDKPDFNSLTKAPNPPDPRQVVEAIARRDQIRVLVDGMTAANDLGLTNAVPAKIIVHTDSRLKPVRLGNLDISFRPTAASKLFWAGRPAMRIVQALHWLRDTTADPEEGQAIRRKLRQMLSREPEGKCLREDLRDGMSALPAWMQDYLRALLAAESEAA
ncbi:hypothetical protein GCM10011515_26680 [Tsuneonella deserti]|uniref:Transcriptional regulator, AbiEi antitoxin, Type IV TA system n=1 Tax=Tsuneonella deserti TaxID=2035528 RepID=A0ABQ1SB16_9SPHN|nr:DUF6088 family protein [Tsuneonella deserti]GGE05815.1 hypothetical protein GCM10011515_26680 [Tsuneonella deserti]